MFLFPDSQPGLHNFSSKGVDWVSFLLGNPLLASSIAHHFFLSRRFFFLLFLFAGSIRFLLSLLQPVPRTSPGRHLLAEGNQEAGAALFRAVLSVPTLAS